ncbi:pentatricopeptide repeat domain-containing protein [Spizellomyces punctatus DAOM BR117]|uniref:Pentatricopeptide repeat domain-containing protein n=1 Tax=Spizellomyces punctatus (strain DAOM BR117) TaxID=645134 RepID=A0A0L0HUP9_SPIPD|nr:pentatricopeptide repeat domain-containing protein [Spizellomyces punctatus DAOM BR117]KND04832.1 pentatricopeptide repeat domain-containing protein [Spizellomyces punctatus DAOM BR117]|eukprot:XP_016612871.1 pentatricopeptide repeat domain-containing protein [Spizellomyces punctatus DAOM BR117]
MSLPKAHRLPASLRRGTRLFPKSKEQGPVSESRSVCSSTAFQPVFYRDVIRVPLNRRTFPLWRHQTVERTIFPADPARLEEQEANFQRRKATASELQRLPGWEVIFQTLESNQPSVDAVVAAKERTLRRARRRENAGYLGPEEVLSAISCAIADLRGKSIDEQNDSIYQLYLKTIKRFQQSSGNLRHHNAVLPGAITKITKDCCRLGRLDLAQTVVAQYMQDLQGIERLEDSERLLAGPFNALIEAYYRAGNREMGQTLLQEMHNTGISPNSRTYSILIRACEPEEVETALQILQMIANTPNMRPRLATLNKVLDLCFTAGGKYRQEASKVFQLLQQIYPIKPGCRTGPNSTTACILLKQCRSEADIELVFRDVQKWSLVRSSRIQAKVLRTASQIAGPTNALSQCLDWANRYAGLGVPLYPESARVVLQAYTDSGSARGGLDFAERLSRFTIQPHEDTLLGLLRSVGRDAEQGGVDRREEEVAWRIWNGLKERSQAPTIRTFVELIDAMGRAGDIRGLWYLYRLMKSKAEGKDVPVVRKTVEDETPEAALLARIDPNDTRLNRAFVRAFGSRLASDPKSAAAVFAAGSNDERSALDLLRSVRDRRQAPRILNDLLGVAVTRGAPLTTDGLGKAFAQVIERARKPEYNAMAFSSAEGLDKIGAWNLRAQGPRPERQIEAARTAVVRAAAHGVADAAASVRSGEDVSRALGALESWIDGRSAEEGIEDVQHALERLEGWTKDVTRQPASG